MNWASLLVGAGLVLFGVALAVGWDVYKTRRDTSRRDASLLFAALAEVEALTATVQHNQELIRTELEALDSGMHLVNPLDPVAGGFWDLVKLDPPQWMLAEPETMATIRGVARLTTQVNEMLRSREAFRVTNLPLANFDEKLQEYDELLETLQGDLLDALGETGAALQRAANGSGLKTRAPRADTPAI